jgi:uncharacterized membrane protein YeiH
VLYWLDLFGIAVFAITGALVAREKKLDLFGVTVIALVTAVGGGTLRDVMLGTTPVFWVRDTNYVIVALLAAIGTVFVVRIRELPQQMLLVADAFGLALFTLLATERVWQQGLPPLIAVIMGVISSVAGGIIRDLMSARIPLILRSELYATASLAGAVVFVLLTPTNPSLAAGLTVLTTLLLRLGAIRWKWTLPVFAPPEASTST